jgi:hypothetical protein
MNLLRKEHLIREYNSADLRSLFILMSKLQYGRERWHPKKAGASRQARWAAFFWVAFLCFFLWRSKERNKGKYRPVDLAW